MGARRLVSFAAILAAGLLQAGVSSAQTGNVQIVRGGQPASINVTREANVSVFRGSPVAAPTATERQMASAASAETIVASGSRIWFVDRAAGTLQACRLEPTTQVGEHRIDCHTRTLPR